MPRLAIIIPEPVLLELIALENRLRIVAAGPGSGNKKVMPQMEEACARAGYTYITYWRRKADYENDHAAQNRRSGGDRRDVQRLGVNRRTVKDRRKSN